MTSPTSPIPVKHTATLPGLAVFLLSSALEQPGWASTPRDHGQAFGLLESILPDLKQPDDIAQVRTQRQCRTINPVWCNEPHYLEFTDRQRDTIKKCLSSLLEKSAMPPGWATHTLLVTFGLTEE